MRRLFVLVSILSLFLIKPVFAWKDNKDVRFEDLDGDYTSEVILTSMSSGGTGVGHEEMRIFKDKDPNLELIFYIETVYEYDLQMNHVKKEAQVTFSEINPKTGAKDIIVSIKEIEYEKEGKPVNKTTDLGKKRFIWNGKKYVEAKMEKENKK